MGAEDAALIQHGVYQGGLAVIDVGDDGDVANFRIAAFHEFTLIGNWGRKRQAALCDLGLNY
jgi:hypothetical protein